MVIKLKKLINTEDSFPNQHTWPIRINVEADGVTSNIFVFQKGKGVVDPYDGAVFNCVASVRQLSEIPTEPSSQDDEMVNPFFRHNTVKFDCMSEDELNLVWSRIQEDVRTLVSNLKASEQLTLLDEVDIS